MLIEFSVANYRSIKELQTISFLAGKIKSKFPEVDENNTFQATAKYHLLKSIVLYGANASGKSNLLKAFSRMLNFINNSVKDENTLQKLFKDEQFALDSNFSDKPSYFQIIFLLEGIPYRYGFEANGEKVYSEWLFYTPKSEEVELFTREDLNVKVSAKHYKEGHEKKNTDLYNSTSLFFTVVASYKGINKSHHIKEYFKNILIISGLNDSGLKQRAISYLEDTNYRDKIIKILEVADTGIKDIKKIEINKDNIPISFPDEIRELIQGGKFKTQFALTSRNAIDQNGNSIFKEFLLEKDESDGTRKLFSYSALLIDTIQSAKIIVIDEFDARFHPLITRKILDFFNSKETNIHNSQILIATHDISLLKADILRRDQIYFAEKDSTQATRYYSLVDFKGIRNDASFDKDYIQGRYGAIPFLGNFEAFLKDHSSEIN